MSIGIKATVVAAFDDVAARAREAIAANGFGVLTEIDVSGTIDAKIGEKIEPLLILGACNPRFAFEALKVSTDVAMLMPCNIVIRREDDVVHVEALDPMTMGRVVGDGLEAVTDQATPILRKIVDDIVAAVDG